MRRSREDRPATPIAMKEVGTPKKGNLSCLAILATGGGVVWLTLAASQCLRVGPLAAVGSPQSAAGHLSKTCRRYNSTQGTLTCARDLVLELREELDHPKSTQRPDLRTP